MLSLVAAAELLDQVAAGDGRGLDLVAAAELLDQVAAGDGRSLPLASSPRLERGRDLLLFRLINKLLPCGGAFHILVFEQCRREFLAEVALVCLAPYRPVTVPIRSVQARLAILLAALDQFQPKGYPHLRLSPKHPS
jgi:hypothetical protein